MIRTFLFWNTQEKQRKERYKKAALAGKVVPKVNYIEVLNNIIKHHNVDIVMLAECDDDSDFLLISLNTFQPRLYEYPYTEAKKNIKVVVGFKGDSVHDVFNDPLSRLTIRHVKEGADNGYLLAILHFQSKVNYDEYDQFSLATTYIADIRRAEDTVGTKRTIVVGDFNMNPYEKPLISATHFHSMMTTKLAKLGPRAVGGFEYERFYNPMWSLLGDRSPGPAGSLYYSASTPGNSFWQMYDQVLLRPALVDGLREVQILTHDGEQSLADKDDKPDQLVGSDHFPLLFKIEL